MTQESLCPAPRLRRSQPPIATIKLVIRDVARANGLGHMSDSLVAECEAHSGYDIDAPGGLFGVDVDDWRDNIVAGVLKRKVCR